MRHSSSTDTFIWTGFKVQGDVHWDIFCIEIFRVLGLIFTLLIDLFYPVDLRTFLFIYLFNQISYSLSWTSCLPVLIYQLANVLLWIPLSTVFSERIHVTALNCVPGCITCKSTQQLKRRGYWNIIIYKVFFFLNVKHYEHWTIWIFVIPDIITFTF